MNTISKKRKRSHSTYSSPIKDPMDEKKMNTKKTKKKMSSFQTTPWYNSNELEHVGRGLFLATCLFPMEDDKSHPNVDECKDRVHYLCWPLQNQEYNHLQESVQRVSIWKTRSGLDNHQIPHSIDASAALAEVILLDAMYTKKNSQMALSSSSTSSTVAPSYQAPGEMGLSCQISPTIVKLSYATAIIRGVNGIADSMLKNRASHFGSPSLSSSVANLCSSIGLPAWVVDIRHDASHNDLPSLAALRLASKTLLHFLLETCVTVLIDRTVRERQKAMHIVDLYIQSCQDMKNISHRVVMPDNVVDGDILPQNVVDSSCCGEKEKNEFNCQEQSTNRKEEEDIMLLDLGDDGDTNSKKKKNYNVDNTSPMNQTNKKNKSKKPFTEYKGLYGAFSILAEATTKKKTDQSRLPRDSTVSKQNLSENMTMTRVDKQDINDMNQSAEHRRKTLSRLLAIARQYAQTVKLDVGYSVSFAYFVWGGISNIPCGYGVLIPTLTSTFEEENIPNLLDEVYSCYIPFIKTLAHVWPGFLHAFMVNLVEFLLNTEKEKTDFLLRTKHDLNINPRQQVEFDLKIISLFSWLRFLLSLEFHSMFDKSLAIMETNVNVRKKKKSAWSQKERSFMEQAVPLSVLQRYDLPLNSLCDRCDEASENSSVAKELGMLFRCILMNERVPFHGINFTNGTLMKLSESSQSRSQDEKDITYDEQDGIIREGSQQQDEQLDAVVIEIESKVAVMDGKIDANIATNSEQLLSLEDMETMLCDPNTSNDSENKKNMEDFDTKNRMNETVKSKKLDKPSPSIIPWQLCMHWDTCAIGTLPGYMS